MVKIRLTRSGVRNNPFYRVVALDERKKKSAIPLEILGYYHPQTKKISLKKENIKKWVEKGAQISPAVKKLMEAK
jgi:small subunit ribosomal protein S16